MGHSLTTSSRKDIKLWSSGFEQAKPVEDSSDTYGAALDQEIGVNDSFQICFNETIHGKLECLKSGSAISLIKCISTCPQPGVLAEVISEG